MTVAPDRQPSSTGGADYPEGIDPSPLPTAAPTRPALVTDLYELTMAAAYHAEKLDYEATFELSVRRLPPERRFLVAAGLEDAVAGLEAFRFTPDDLAYLSGLDLFPEGFLDRLGELRFSGELWAVPEGEIVYAGEPLLRVTAPLVEAQLVETFLLNRIASQTMLASKAARVAIACGDRRFVDFSARRDHGVDAALATARASWIAGAAGTSLVAAGQRFGIPVSGTMAHSYVLAYEDEADAFRAFARSFPRAAVLLIDTYDTLEGAERAIQVAKELAPSGFSLAGVRLDSGDLATLSRQVRSRLNDAGLGDADIVASGDLDEHRVQELLAVDAPIDVFGVGTQLGTSGDAPSLGAVYKLVEDASGPRMKLATGKVTLPGRKQVWRLDDADVVGLHDEDLPGRPLLVKVMDEGRRTAPPEPLAAVRDRCTAALAALPPELRSLEPTETPLRRVETSPALRALADRVRTGRLTGRPDPHPSPQGERSAFISKTDR